MEFCDLCGNEFEDGETYSCTVCGITFCCDCGDPASDTCGDCEQEQCNFKESSKPVNGEKK